jgi:N-hydroxyarylamine O-acetyltransferase
MNKTAQFLQRISMNPDTSIEHTVDFLGLIQTNCVLNIAYENLDILGGRPLDLKPEALFEKIVLHHRGGYCFEVNGLLAYMLREMGFTVTERFARFLRGESTIPMRRHRVVVVTLEGNDYLLDIGVGQTAPRLPLKITEGEIQTQNGETYRFRRDSVHGWVLCDLYQGAWRDYICFTDDLAYEIDFVQPSFFCEAHPDSIFNKKPMLSIKTIDGRRTIDGDTYKVFYGDTLTHIEEGISEERLNELLHREFKLFD